MKHQSKKQSKVEWPDWFNKSREPLKPPEKLTVSQWSDKNRILDEKTSSAPGPWKTSTTPYLQGVMDAFNDPEIEETIFVKPTQVGGTEALNNMIGYAICQDPSSALIVYPTLELAEYASKNRVQPMVDLSPALKQKYHIRDSKDMELQFDGMYIVFAGANSPASLASRPIRYLFFDEVDKYPAYSGKEADPISLGKERTKTFPYNKKIFITSTPTTKRGNVWVAMESADEVRKYYVTCPHCGREQTFEFRQLKWPKEYNHIADVIELTYYECEECKGVITDQHKINMIRNGKWKSKNPSPIKRKVAFHLNTLYSPWVRFGQVAYEFLKSKDFPDKLMNFVNSWLGEPWEDTQAKMNSDKVLERQSEFEETVVPDGTALITAGVDVQKDHFYYTVRAWSTSMTSWNITHGIADTWNQIENVMNFQYQDKNGNSYQVNLCAVDSGDRTDEVYDFCVYNQEWAVPVKGSSNPLLARYKVSMIEKVDSKAYGMKLYIVDGGQYKDMIAGRMNRPNGPGSWMVYNGCDRDYAEQICAEEKILEKKGSKEIEVWRPKTTHAANHYLDAEVYAALAADLLHVRYLQVELPPQQQPVREQPNEFIKNADSWIKREGGWLK